MKSIGMTFARTPENLFPWISGQSKACLGEVKTLSRYVQVHIQVCIYKFIPLRLQREAVEDALVAIDRRKDSNTVAESGLWLLSMEYTHIDTDNRVADSPWKASCAVTVSD